MLYDMQNTVINNIFSDGPKYFQQYTTQIQNNIKEDTVDVTNTVCLIPNTEMLINPILYLIVVAISCSKGDIKSKDGIQCISESSYCDGYKDCNDGSDEDPDMCRGIVCVVVVLFRLGLWWLTPLSTIFQLYRGHQFYWMRKSEYPVVKKLIHHLLQAVYC